MPPIWFSRIRLIPPRDGWERGMVAVLLALAFLAVNGLQSASDGWFLHFRNPRADYLAVEVALLLPGLLVVLAIPARRSWLRTLSLWLGIPIGALGLLGACISACCLPGYPPQMGAMPLCRPLPLAGGVGTLDVTGWDRYRVEITENVPVLPGTALTRHMDSSAPLAISKRDSVDVHVEVFGPRRVRVIVPAFGKIEQREADVDLDLPLAGR